MTPFEEAMAAPRIEVIDAAIESIENGQERYTCFALGAAVRSAIPGLTLDELVDVRRRYCWQYELSCMTDGARPRWWNCQQYRHLSPRIAALKNFRQLCRDAAK